MATPCATHVDFTVLDAASVLAIAMGGAADPYSPPGSGRPRVVTTTAVVGAWRSPDGVVKLQLRKDGTYAGEVSGRRRPARGTYWIQGESVLLRDDSGLHTDVHVHDGELEMAGHRLRPASAA
ncbi:Atu4866 domain-containing protein [Actinoplanes sp. NEAU-A12]|uniref:Atu4866 domain-containing protein n=1 Tax=Actinoplanes sandaracinus TaxID=3045177 RepID=A0ABT6WLA6_9ACTN|nr:Atu4866 domain-containing protein [Actinoplanes sandaracinus]MDI6100509.1 Atu4866 domain-containing protein [Actinoplanes sandaracinus]